MEHLIWKRLCRRRRLLFVVPRIPADWYRCVFSTEKKEAEAKERKKEARRKSELQGQTRLMTRPVFAIFFSSSSYRLLQFDRLFHSLVFLFFFFVFPLLLPIKNVAQLGPPETVPATLIDSFNYIGGRRRAKERLRLHRELSGLHGGRSGSHLGAGQLLCVCAPALSLNRVIR